MSSSGSVGSEGIRIFHQNLVIDGRSLFDGCIDLAKFTEMLDSSYQLKEPFNKNLPINSFKQLFVKYLLKALFQDPDFVQIIQSPGIHYDYKNNALIIEGAVFGFKYSNIKQLLVDFNIIEPSSMSPTLYVTTNTYGRLLVSHIKETGASITPSELEKILQRQKENGEKGERFVVEYEKNRLKREDIEWVAKITVNEGYDIASYNSPNDKEFNRFIEVKSYSKGNPVFYWSRNEIRKAKAFTTSYWLYLVDLSRIKDKTYSPLMICNPANNILDNPEWISNPELLCISFNGGHED